MDCRYSAKKLVVTQTPQAARTTLCNPSGRLLKA